jgi:hypothetical protein
MQKITNKCEGIITAKYQTEKRKISEKTIRSRRK